GDNREGSLLNPLTTTMLGYYRPEYDSFTLSTLMNSYTTALYCCGNSILRDTLRVLQRKEVLDSLILAFRKTCLEIFPKWDPKTIAIASSSNVKKMSYHISTFDMKLKNNAQV